MMSGAVKLRDPFIEIPDFFARGRQAEAGGGVAPGEGAFEHLLHLALELQEQPAAAAVEPVLVDFDEPDPAEDRDGDRDAGGGAQFQQAVRTDAASEQLKARRREFIVPPRIVTEERLVARIVGV